MKRSILKITLFLTLFAFLLGSLPSCAGILTNLKDPVKMAEVVMSKADAREASASSLTVTTTFEGSFPVSSMTVTVSGTNEHVWSGRGEQDYRTVETSVVHRVCRDLDMDDTVTTISGFMDGKMFMSGENAKLYSELTVEEYILHEEASVSDMDIGAPNLKDCREHTCTREKDGSYTITASGVPAGYLSRLEEVIGFGEILEDGVALTDLVMTVRVSKSFDYESIRMEMVFGDPDEEAGTDTSSEETDTSVKETEEDGMPTLTMEIVYADRDTTTVEDVDFDAYQKAADLRIIDRLNNTIRDYQTAAKADFTVKVTNTFSGAGLGTQESEETDEIHTEIKDGAYTYKIVATLDAYNYTFTYENGKQNLVVKQGSKVISSTTEDQTEMEARAFIRSQLNPMSFSPDMVTSVKKTSLNADTTSWVIGLSDPDLTAAQNAADQMGATVSSGTGRLTVQTDDFDNGRIIGWTYELTVKMQLQGTTLTLKITSVMTLEPLEETPAFGVETAAA